MKLKHFFLKSLLILFITGLVLPSPVFAEQETASNFLIKLNSSDLSALSSVASKLEQKFTFSTKPQFQNVYSFSSNFDINKLKEKLSGSYEYIEQNQTLQTHAQITPNDPGFTLNPLNIDKQWGLAKTGFPEVWDKEKGSSKTIVAVVDTGIDQTHEDFVGVKFVTGFNTLSRNIIVPGINSDDNGHGTLVTGIIGASPNNGIGIAGTNWQISLMPIKALDAAGSGSSSSVSEAIVWAADQGANIINLSLGGIGFGHDTTLANAITYAFRKDVVIVAAAGNDVAITGGNLDQEPVFPICDDNGENMIIGVLATDFNDQKPSFSNFGKACIDVAAPGRRILSTINHDPLSGAIRPDDYAYASGTSMAVPFVVGQAALLKSKFPGATNKQIRDRILSSADPIDSLNLSQCNGSSCAGLLGTGRINVVKSLAQEIVTPNLKDGDVVQIQTTGNYYYINGGKRQYISPFVKSQRFGGAVVKVVTLDDLARYPESNFAAPLEGTLIKLTTDPTVYYISKDLKLPVTGQIFNLRRFKFTDVVSLSYTEVNSWLTGNFLAPPDGSLVRTAKDTTVYWAVEGVLHPINFNFYQARGLTVFPVVYVSDNDLKSFSKGDAYIL